MIKFTAKPGHYLYSVGALKVVKGGCGSKPFKHGLRSAPNLKPGSTRIFFLFVLLVCAAAQAQDAVRYSIASERAAESRKRSRAETYYNLDLDPVKLRFSTSVGTEYNDNVNLSSIAPLEDYLIRPQVGVRAYWPVSDRNTLDVNFNLGYEYYFNGARPSRVTVTGDEDSGLFFDIYVGDFAIELHDRFSLSQETSSDPSISGIADIFRLENTLGTAVTWDLNKLVLRFDYDHLNYIPLDSVNKRLAHESDLGSLEAAASLNPALTTGLQLGGGFTRYEEPDLSDNQHVSLGPFVRYQVGQAVDIKAHFGYATYWFDASNYITNQTSLSSFYADITLSHRPTERTSQSLNFGQSLSTDINSSPIETIYVRYSATFNIIRYWSFRPSLTLESGTESRGLVTENFTRYGAGLSVSRQITEKLAGNVSYLFLQKNSDVAAFDYNQNRLVLDLIYQF